jgi:hypothetical protein
VLTAQPRPYIRPINPQELRVFGLLADTNLRLGGGDFAAVNPIGQHVDHSI